MKHALIRMSDEEHAVATAKATAERISMNKLVVRAILAYEARSDADRARDAERLRDLERRVAVLESRCDVSR